MFPRFGIIVISCLLLYLLYSQATAESAGSGRNTHEYVGAADFDATLYTKTEEGEDDTADEWFENLISVHKAIADSRQTGIKIPSVKVAIIDSGVCMQHPIIKEHIKRGAINKHRCKAFPETLDHLDDKNGHGTHTTSVLLQTAPDIELYIARVTNDVGKILEDDDFEGVLDAINWAIEQEVDVISLSWGFPDDNPHSRIANAIRNAHSKNIVIVAAAANHGRMNQIAFPAKLRDHVICIGAARRNGTTARFAAEDPHFQGFTAPGVGVRGASIRNMSSWGGDKTERKDGTSSATPIAAGIAALFIEYCRINELGEAGSHRNMVKLFSAMSADYGETYRFLRPWTLLNKPKVKDVLEGGTNELGILNNSREIYQYNAPREDTQQILLQDINDRDKRELLEWLSPGDEHSSGKHGSIIERRVENTGTWFINEFDDWLKDNSQMLLLGTGKAGAGKSFLTSTAIEYLRKNPGRGTPVYIYFERSHCEDLTPRMVARILVKQAARQVNRVSTYLSQAKKIDELPQFDTLIGILKDYSIEFSRTTNMVVMFDALDECEAKYFGQMVKLIRNLNKFGIRVYATAREHCDYALSQLEAKRLKVQANVEDVKKYLVEKLEEHETEEMTPGFRKEIVDAVVQGVDGMFLLARLRLNYILDVSGESLMRLRFDTLPVDEIEAYTEIMDRITKSKDENSKKIILRVLSWTRGSQRFLSIRELREVIWVEEGDTELRKKEIDGLRLDHIIRNCESLVTYDHTGVIRFSHTTVYEFLEKTKFAKVLMSEAALAKTCLTYLNFNVFGVPSTTGALLDEYIFGVYAATYWVIHAENANTKDVMWNDLLLAIVDTFQEDGKWESMNQMKDHGFWIPWNVSKTLLHVLVENGLATYYMQPMSNKISNALSKFLQQTNMNATDSGGCTVVHYAAKRREWEIVKWLIGKNANMDAVDCNHCTILHYAAGMNEWEAVKWLSTNGANMEAVDLFGKTVLHWACIRREWEVVKWLIGKKANMEAVDDENCTILHYAADVKEWEAVKWLIKNGANKEAVDNQGRTVLHQAAQKLEWGVVKWLIENGANREARDSNGCTILHHATRKQEVGAVKLLIKKNINLDAKDNYGQTSLHHAVASCYWELVKIFAENNANMDARDNYGQTAMHHAVANYHWVLLKWLIDGNANVHATDNYERTVLHHVVRHGRVEVVQWLIEKNAHVDAKDADGRTVLHHAVEYWQWDVAKELIKHNANINARDYYGQTALLHVAKSGHWEIVKWLIENKANVDATADFGRTVLHYAAISGELEVVELLIEKNVNVNAADSNGWTALHHATLSGELEIVKLLIEGHVNMNAADNNGWTALHHAARGGHLGVVKWLFEKKANVDATDTDGCTVLHHAAKSGKLELVKWLIEVRGGLVSLKSIHGQSALDIAALLGNVEICRLLSN